MVPVYPSLNIVSLYAIHLNTIYPDTLRCAKGIPSFCIHLLNFSLWFVLRKLLMSWLETSGNKIIFFLFPSVIYLVFSDCILTISKVHFSDETQFNFLFIPCVLWCYDVPVLIILFYYYYFFLPKSVIVQNWWWNGNLGLYFQPLLRSFITHLALLASTWWFCSKFKKLFGL